MASIEFITKKVTNKENEIKKLEKKLERIEKAKAGNWEVNNPYGYYELDLTRTVKELAKAKEALIAYQAELATAQEKANSRNIEAILKFLEAWKERVVEYYKTSIVTFFEELEKNEALDEEYKNTRFRDPRYKELRKEHVEREARFWKRWNFIREYIYSYSEKTLDMETLLKDLNREAEAKYDFIIERTNDIVGQITDASDLKIGKNDELNGLIKGTRGTAMVETIGAGGYNIQCYHFRTLIKPQK